MFDLGLARGLADVAAVGTAFNAVDAFNAGNLGEGLLMAVGTALHVGNKFKPANWGKEVNALTGAATNLDTRAGAGPGSGGTVQTLGKALGRARPGAGGDPCGPVVREGRLPGGILSLGQSAASVYAMTQSCFTAETKLRTPSGWQRINSFVAGDQLLSRPEHDPAGPIEGKVVEEVFQRTGRVWHLHVGGQVIRTSGEHPFYEQTKGWTEASLLEPGDRLAGEDGQWIEVEEVYDTGEWETLYNLRVADCHTYFVGDEGWGFSVWAHNNNGLCGNLSAKEKSELRGDLRRIAKRALNDMDSAAVSGKTTIRRRGVDLRTPQGDPQSGGRGPVLTVLKDLKTGEVFIGQNQGQVVGNLHPVLQRRLNKYLRDNPQYAGNKVYPYPGRPGSHAEIDASIRLCMPGKQRGCQSSS